MTATLWDRLAREGHEQVVFHADTASGLRVVVAIHSTLLGPALGGTRWQPYASDADALDDALKLSRAMTAKAALARLLLGGGKAVVAGDPNAKSDAQLRAYGRFIESLGGRYITTTDVGTTTAEIDRIAGETRHVVGTSPELGGSGDTSALTAETVLHGIRAGLEHVFGLDSLARRRVVVIGIGKVGARVARALVRAGAEVIVADVRADAAALFANELGAKATDAGTAHTIACDVLSPNALGGLLTEETIPQLNCRIVCGGANNQLARDPQDAALLAEREILYVPDYMVNSGGLINVAVEREGYDAERAAELAAGVFETAQEVLALAKQRQTTPAEAASRIVAERLAAARRPAPRG